jgi:hypothetical protein
MTGGLYIIRHNGQIERRKLTRPPTAEELHEIVGGYLEVVPYWTHLKTLGRCVAFCDSNGKTTGGKKFNKPARAMWKWHHHHDRSGYGECHFAGKVPRDCLLGIDNRPLVHASASPSWAGAVPMRSWP